MKCKNIKSNKKDKQLTIKQKNELEEWDKKIESGEAFKKAKEYIKNHATISCDPNLNIKEIAKKVLPKHLRGEETTEEDEKNLEKAVYDYGFENDISIIEAVEEKYRGMMLELKRNIIKEYDCKAFSEKALVDLAVNAYSRNLTLSRMLVNTATTGRTTKEINNFLSIMSKDVDRANRHFITALETLKQFKQPQLKVNVKAKNAFIAEKQQFNNNQNEKIKTK